MLQLEYMNKNVLFTFTLTLALLTSGLFFAQPANAQFDSLLDDIEGAIISGQRLLNEGLDIESTAAWAGGGIIKKLAFPMVFGQTLGEIQQCAPTSSCGYGTGSTSSSGLLELAANFGNYAGSDAQHIPIRYAYYFNDVAIRTPLLNSVYAQQPQNSGAFVGGTFVLEMWKIVRNISYGLLATVSLISGVMIIARKQINPQTVVTVQLVIPKLIIAAVLVTFSYVIGSTFVQMIIPLNGIARFTMMEAAQGFGVPNFSQINVGSDTVNDMVFVVLATLGLVAVGTDQAQTAAPFFAGANPVIYLMLILVFVLMIIAFLYAALMILVVSLRLAIDTVIAPIIFVMGAIPGNEAMTINWFKRQFARVLAVPAMQLAILSVLVLFRSAVNAGDNYVTGDWITVGGGIEAWFIWIMVPIIALIILTMSVTIPKKVENAILGDPRKR